VLPHRCAITYVVVYNKGGLLLEKRSTPSPKPLKIETTLSN
jgi:hypothetical protein